MSDLEIQLGKLQLKNPLILASGTFDRAIATKIDMNKLGGLITKTITLNPRPGNPPPHIIKTKYGWLNSVGLKNPGIKKYLLEELPFWQKFNMVIIPSIGGYSKQEYLKLAQIFEKENILAIEINISCPNIDSEEIIGTDINIVGSLIKKIRQIFSKNIIVKLSPNVTDIVKLAKSALESGADIISLTNTFIGMEIDNKTKKAIFHRKVGGYSGPAIKPISLRMVWEVYKNLKCPIIGGGGITNLSDALDFMMVGATAVAIGSANLTNPTASIKILNGLEKYCKSYRLKNINQIKGIIK